VPGSRQQRFEGGRARAQGQSRSRAQRRGRHEAQVDAAAAQQRLGGRDRQLGARRGLEERRLEHDGRPVARRRHHRRRRRGRAGRAAVPRPRTRARGGRSPRRTRRRRAPAARCEHRRRVRCEVGRTRRLGRHVAPADRQARARPSSRLAVAAKRDTQTGRPEANACTSSRPRSKVGTAAGSPRVARVGRLERRHDDLDRLPACAPSCCRQHGEPRRGVDAAGQHATQPQARRPRGGRATARSPGPCRIRTRRRRPPPAGRAAAPAATTPRQEFVFLQRVRRVLAAGPADLGAHPVEQFAGGRSVPRRRDRGRPAATTRPASRTRSSRCAGAANTTTGAVAATASPAARSSSLDLGRGSRVPTRRSRTPSVSGISRSPGPGSRGCTPASDSEQRMPEPRHWRRKLRSWPRLQDRRRTDHPAGARGSSCPSHRQFGRVAETADTAVARSDSAAKIGTMPVQSTVAPRSGGRDPSPTRCQRPNRGPRADARATGPGRRSGVVVPTSPRGLGAADCRIDLKLLRWRAAAAAMARSATARHTSLPFPPHAHPDLWAGTVQDGTARGFAVRLEEAIALAGRPVALPPQLPPPPAGARVTTGKELKKRKDVLIASAEARVRVTRKEGPAVRRPRRRPARQQLPALRGQRGSRHARRRSRRDRTSGRACSRRSSCNHSDSSRATQAPNWPSPGRLGRGPVGWPCLLVLRGDPRRPAVQLTIRIDHRLPGWRLRARFLGVPLAAIAHACTPVHEVVQNDAGGFVAFTLVRAATRLFVGDDEVATPGAACIGPIQHTFWLGTRGVAPPASASLDRLRRAWLAWPGSSAPLLVVIELLCVLGRWRCCAALAAAPAPGMARARCRAAAGDDGAGPRRTAATVPLEAPTTADPSPTIPRAPRTSRLCRDRPGPPAPRRRAGRALPGGRTRHAGVGRRRARPPLDRSGAPIAGSCRPPPKRCSRRSSGCATCTASWSRSAGTGTSNRAARRSNAGRDHRRAADAAARHRGAPRVGGPPAAARCRPSDVVHDTLLLRLCADAARRARRHQPVDQHRAVLPRRRAGRCRSNWRSSGATSRRRTGTRRRRRSRLHARRRGGEPPDPEPRRRAGAVAPAGPLDPRRAALAAGGAHCRDRAPVADDDASCTAAPPTEHEPAPAGHRYGGALLLEADAAIRAC
jgi:hypothetical protein